MSTGHILNESNADYHANPAISHSKLEVFRQRPALFKRRYIDQAIEAESSDALTFGSALHCAVLEPALFGESYVVQPAEIKQRRGKAWAEFEASVPAGVDILRPAEMELIDTLVAQVAGNGAAMDLIGSKGALVESSFRTEGSEWGVAMQCRPDVYNPSGCEFSAMVPYLADVKTVESFDRFGKQFYDLGYFRQSPFYRGVIERVRGAVVPQRFFYIVVEKQEPHGVTVLEVDGLAMSEGQKEVDEALQRLGRCFASGDYPNLPETGYIGLPDWVVRQIEFSSGEAA